MQLIATIRKSPPDHQGGYDLPTEEISEPCTDYHQARAALGERVPDGWQIIALRTALDD